MKVRYSRVYRHHVRKKAYTYIKSKQSKTKKGLPNKRLLNFTQGSLENYHHNILNSRFNLVSDKTVLLTEISLEAFRVTFTRLLLKQYARHNWHYRICKTPHIILRKHKLPVGGHVDRVSMGMRLAYGVPFARAAKISEGEVFIRFCYNETICKLAVIKAILSKANSKLAIRLSIVH